MTVVTVFVRSDVPVAPASMQPRKTTGHCGVSSIASMMRLSGAKPRLRSALAN